MIVTAFLVLLAASMSFGLAVLLHRTVGSGYFRTRVVIAGSMPLLLLFMIVLLNMVIKGRAVFDALSLIAGIPFQGKLFQGVTLATCLFVSLVTSAWRRKIAEQEIFPSKVFE